MMRRQTAVLAVVVMLFVQSPVAHGQTYTILGSFNGTNGAYPSYGGLTLSGSTLYGMTEYGGGSHSGNIFSINTNGTGLKNLFSFNANGTNGAYPYGSLTLSGSTLYGTTQGSGSSNSGNIFSINTNGTGFQNYLVQRHQRGLSLWRFDPERLNPVWDDLWRRQRQGHHFFDPHQWHRLSKPALVQRHQRGWSLWQFDPERLNPVWDDLLAAARGNGTIFSIHTDGTGFQNLFSFNGTNGADPWGSLTLSGSTLYGMTSEDGGSGKGNIFSINTNGTGFQNLLSFNGTNGAYPYGDLTLSGSTLYGMTYRRRQRQAATFFRSTPMAPAFRTCSRSTAPTGLIPMAI